MTSVPRKLLHAVIPPEGRRRLRSLGLDIKALRYRINPAPVFVLGNQKSGTSVLAGLLAARCGRTVTIDIRREIHDPSFHRVGPSRLSHRIWVRRMALSFSTDIVKEPNLTLMAAQLREMFPRARFVGIVRSPAENIRSIFDRLGLDGAEPDAPADPARLPTEGWRVLLDGGWQGMPSAGPVELMAQRWVKTAQAMRALGDDILIIRYEDFVRDKTRFVDEAAAFVGLRGEHDLTPLLDRQFQPRGKRAGEAASVFGANRAIIERVCGEAASGFGYRCAGFVTDD